MLVEISCRRTIGESLAEYEQEWARIEIRDTRMVALLFAEILVFLPAAWVVVKISSRLFPGMRPGYAWSFFMWCYLFLFVFTGFRRFRYPCPRCGKNFLGKPFGLRSGRTCAHCGLLKPRRVTITE
jgi:hypothetical protein